LATAGERAESASGAGFFQGCHQANTAAASANSTTPAAATQRSGTPAGGTRALPSETGAAFSPGTLPCCR
jgi:hypothetical protein